MFFYIVYIYYDTDKLCYTKCKIHIFYLKANQNKQWLPGDSTLAMDVEILQAIDELGPEVLKFKKDENIQQTESASLKKNSDFPQNICEQQVQHAENISPSSPGSAWSPSERKRTRTQGKKDNDWRDLAQKLLFSETKKTEAGGRGREMNMTRNILHLKRLATP